MILRLTLKNEEEMLVKVSSYRGFSYNLEDKKFVSVGRVETGEVELINTDYIMRVKIEEEDLEESY